MDDLAPRVRRGAHRPRRDPLRGLLAALVLLVALALVGLGFALWRPGRTGETVPAARSQPQAPGSVASQTPAATSARPAAKPSAPSSPSAGTVSPTPSPSPSPSRTQSAPVASPTAPSPTPSASPSGGGAGSVQVLVLNSTGRQGLAQRTAVRLRREGWQISAVTNFRGTIDASTVLYPAGRAAAARSLAADLPIRPRVRPIPGNYTGLPPDQLVLVLAADYPS